MNARERILARLRHARHPAGARTPTRRQGDAEGPIRPRLGDDLMARFTARLEAAAATVATVSGVGEVAEAVADYLTAAGLPGDVTHTAEPWLEGIAWPDHLAPWPAVPGIESEVLLTGVFAAVAETGTLVLLSGPDTPSTAHFLADTHIAVVPADKLVGHLDEVWPLVRAVGVPRAVHFITGPSRTADIEQTMHLGAHGPCRLHVIVAGARPRAGP